MLRLPFCLVRALEQAPPSDRSDQRSQLIRPMRRLGYTSHARLSLNRRASVCLISAVTRRRNCGEERASGHTTMITLRASSEQYIPALPCSGAHAADSAGCTSAKVFTIARTGSGFADSRWSRSGLAEFALTVRPSRIPCLLHDLESIRRTCPCGIGLCPDRDHAAPMRLLAHVGPHSPGQPPGPG